MPQETTSSIAEYTLPLNAVEEPAAIEPLFSASHEVFAEAHELGLRTALGCPYAGVNIVVRKGELTALRGRNNSGKTALLLTLAARMAHNQGTLTILGESMPKYRSRVQRRIGLGLIKGVNDLRSNLMTSQVTASELGVFKRPSKREDVSAYLREWDLFDIARMSVGDLSREMMVMLGIALGMAGEPEGLAVDDVEDQLTMRQSMRLMDRLASIAHERNVAVIVACTERDLALRADCVYELG